MAPKSTLQVEEQKCSIRLSSNTTKVLGVFTLCLVTFPTSKTYSAWLKNWRTRSPRASSCWSTMPVLREMTTPHTVRAYLLPVLCRLTNHNSSPAKNGQPDMSDPVAISKHFLKTEPENWADTLKTNVTAGYWTSMAFLPLLAKGNKRTPGYTSSIVNVSSISGAMKGNSAGQFSYATSKAAFTHLSRMLATAFVDVKVRVNVIAPGVFPSEMTTGSSDEDNKSTIDMTSTNPAGRKGKDTDMAATIIFLASKGGVFVNEQILYIDGQVIYQN